MVWQTPLLIGWNVLTMLFVGFREESCFRGIVLHIFADKYLKDRRGILITAFASAAFFGLMHINNVLIGQSLGQSVHQTVNAFVMGTLFAAVYLRGGSLWAVMLLHGFIDLGMAAKNMLTKTYASDAMAYLASNREGIDLLEIILSLVMWSIFVLIALFLLRKKKCGEIVERFASEKALEPARSR